MNRCFCAVLLSAAVLVSISSAASADIIFDNTTTFLGTRTVTARQLGNQVQIEGSGWSVTELEIGVSQQGGPGTADLQAFLYANDGNGGAPGTLLWRSALQTDVALSGGNDLIAFAVPSILVPTVFTWTLQIAHSLPTTASLPSYNPPTEGGILHGWFGGPRSWTRLDLQGGSSHFMVRIAATMVAPEPSTGTGVVLSLMLGLGWSNPRTRRS